MAIVVEEEGGGGSSSSSIIRILMWLVILGIIGATVYYVFFKRPDILPNLTTPAALKGTQELAKLRFPKEILNSTGFLSLHQYVPVSTLPPSGRTNPFVPF
jgi:hypothetical protein